MKNISAKELDEKFDNGEDISDYLDWESARRGPGFEEQYVSVDLPLKMLRDLDEEAARLGVTRDRLVAQWLRERLGKASDAAE